MDYIKNKNWADFKLSVIIRKVLEIHRESKFYLHRKDSISFFAFISAITIYIKRGFSPKEMNMYGFKAKRISEVNLDRYCSKNHMLKLQECLNPKSWQHITADKGIFYRYCGALNLPIPELYGLFFKHSAGWSSNGDILKNHEDWIKFIQFELPHEFVIKPATGAYGRGIKVFERSGNGKFVSSGKRYLAKDVYEMMSMDSHYESFLIQERLRSHPSIVELSNSENLQTARMITFIDRSGQIHILHAFLKIIVGKNIVDNIDSGKTGNLVAEISLKTGTLKPAIAVGRDGSGLQQLAEHPTTGVVINGFQLPFWEQARSVVKEAALKFLPKRTIGWDLALTPRDVKILEGNGRYDPPLTHQRISEFLSFLIEN